MNIREKLVELLNEVQETGVNEIPAGFGCTREYVKNEKVASHLIAHDVTVQGVGGCCRCKDTSEMMVAISNKLVAGVRTGWLGGNLPARYCPFCGRKLPQPPKGE